MKLFRNHKKIGAAAVALTVALVGGGVAYAYYAFTATASGAGSTAPAVNWGITVGTASGTITGPGVGSETIPYTVTNYSHSSQTLDGVYAQVANDLAAQENSAYPACTWADFSINGQAPNPGGGSFFDVSLAGTFAAGASNSGSVTLTMVNASTIQNNCEGLTVPMVFTASSTPPVNANLSLDPAPPNGSAGWYPNPNFDNVTTIPTNSPAALTVTVIQNNGVLADGTITVNYDPLALTLVTSPGDGTCTTGSGTVSCTFTDLSHSATSKPFSFTTNAITGVTNVSATVTNANGSWSQDFPLNIG